MFRVLGTSSAKILASSQAHGHGMRANLSGSAVLQNKVGGGKKGKGGAAVTKKKVFDVETDTKVLLTTVAGSNYRTTEGSSDVVLKEDSEYPDWLWSLDVTRPVPAAKDLPKGTMEYFVRLHEEEKLRQNRMAKGKRFRRPWYNPAEKIMEIH